MATSEAGRSQGHSDAGTGAKGPAAGAAAGTGEADATRRVAGDWRELDFALAVTLRYHKARQGFFETLHQIGLFAAALAGGGGFVSTIPDAPDAAKFVALVAALMTAADLAVGFAQRAGRHADLHRRFTDIAARLLATPMTDGAAVARLRAERLTVETREPLPMRTLSWVCFDQEAASRGYPEHRYRIGWIHRQLAQVITLRSDFPPMALPR